MSICCHQVSQNFLLLYASVVCLLYVCFAVNGVYLAWCASNDAAFCPLANDVRFALVVAVAIIFWSLSDDLAADVLAKVVRFVLVVADVIFPVIALVVVSLFCSSILSCRHLFRNFIFEIAAAVFSSSIIFICFCYYYRVTKLIKADPLLNCSLLLLGRFVCFVEVTKYCPKGDPKNFLQHHLYRGC